MGETYALELRDISKRFGSVQANDHVNLTLRKSEILAILGENGSGKTTLMNMIYGIYYPDEGHIFVNGKEVTICSPKDSYELGIGMVHQHFKLVDVLTAAENIVLGLPGKARLNMKKIKEDIQKLADTFESFQNGTLEDVKGFCKVADLEEIAKQDYILTPGRYVGIEEQEDDGEPFEEKMTRLTSELSDLFAKSHELEKEIRKKLGAIGYEI